MAISGSESDDDTLPLSGPQHLAFCPRQWAMIHLEQVWVENVKTAEGRLLHEGVDLPGENRRGKVRTVRGTWLRSGKAALDRTRRHRGVSTRTVSGGVQTGQEQATDCDTVQLCAGALPGRDVADSHSTKRLMSVSTRRSANAARSSSVAPWDDRKYSARTLSERDTNPPHPQVR
jgi:Domain of unknown function DUF83